MLREYVPDAAVNVVVFIFLKTYLSLAGLKSGVKDSMNSAMNTESSLS